LRFHLSAVLEFIKFPFKNKSVFPELLLNGLSEFWNYTLHPFMSPVVSVFQSLVWFLGNHNRFYIEHKAIYVQCCAVAWQPLNAQSDHYATPQQ
jgi:hypothetical protein